jgi:hypothetical protein
VFTKRGSWGANHFAGIRTTGELIGAGGRIIV